MKRLAELFWEFLRISTCVVGGGYAILAVAEEVFARKGWTREGELTERLSVFQMIPGLVATHTAVYVGSRTAGPRGAAVAVFAVVLPSVGFFMLVANGYQALPLENVWLQSAFAGLRSALTAVIAHAVVQTWRKASHDAFYRLTLLACLLALSGLELAVPQVLIGAMLFGLADAFRDARQCCCVGLLSLAVFLKYGLLAFGGGFVLVPMYLQDFVGQAAPYVQLSAEDFSNVMALSQTTPGPIGINAATFLGYRLAGIPGALIASVLLVLPGSFLAYYVFRSLERYAGSKVVRGILRGVQPASLALMLVALHAFARSAFTDPVPIAVSGLGLVLLLTRKMGALPVIFGSAAVCVLFQACRGVLE